MTRALRPAVGADRDRALRALRLRLRRRLGRCRHGARLARRRRPLEAHHADIATRCGGGDRRCRGSCSCCTPGSRGGIRRSSSASGRARPATGAWSSGRRRGCGSGCTRFCFPSCGPPVRSIGRVRSRLQSCAGEKGVPQRVRARLIEPETAPSTTFWSTPACLDGYGRQPQRRHPTDPVGRPGAAGTRQGGTASPPSRPPHRRPRLRPRHVPARAAPARHRLRDRAPPDRTRLRARSRALGRRTRLRLATPLQEAACPLRPPPRDSRRLPRARLLPRLFQETQPLIGFERLGNE